MNRNYGWILAGMLTLTGWTLHAKDKTAPPPQDRLDGKPITLARYAKALVGEGNVSVEIAPYQTEDGKKCAILLFSGVEGAWDGKAVNYVVRDTDAGVDYVTQDKGRERTTLTQRKRGNETTYRLYLPETPGEIILVPSDGAAQLTTPRRILETYLGQQKAEK